MSIAIGRREVIAAIGVAMVWPLAAHAQQPVKIPRVGILSPAASEDAAHLTAFRQEIRDLGYIDPAKRDHLKFQKGTKGYGKGPVPKIELLKQCVTNHHFPNYLVIA